MMATRGDHDTHGLHHAKGMLGLPAIWICNESCARRDTPHTTGMFHSVSPVERNVAEMNTPLDGKARS